MIAVDFSDSLPKSASAIAFPVPKDALAAAAMPGLDAGSAALVRAAAKAQRFDGEAGSIVEQFVDQGGGPVRAMLVGIGNASATDMEKAGAGLTARFHTSGETALAVDLTGLTIAPSADAVTRLAAGAALRGWRHDVYRTKLTDKQKPTLTKLTIVGAPPASAKGWPEQAAVTKGVAFTRELVTEPANIIYPESFVERCRAMEAMGVRIRVLGKAEMTELGMGALLGVSQGSVREPQLLVLEWDGSGGKQTPPVLLIGKGVTFDTGGISIKPAGGMEDMKWDMGGAGAVAGAMMAIAGRKSKAHVVGVCALVENMPDGAAQRPGDVVTSMSGQTIEVINTDAEGRLVLCDAMTWAQREYRPKVMVDLATLTGAIITSLGFEHGGIFSNDEPLAGQLIAAGAAAGDPLWRFPLSPAYDKLIDSPIADMKNVGPREGGSITAAQFLLRYVDEGVAWAHLDIAGMVWSAKPGAVWDKGATGFGVRLLDRFIADNFEG